MSVESKIDWTEEQTKDISEVELINTCRILSKLLLEVEPIMIITLLKKESRIILTNHIIKEYKHRLIIAGGE
tara:strand:- start:7411 stop:7626 length:216 start_codon:yes stop_codon:yes gene_type:complete